MHEKKEDVWESSRRDKWSVLLHGVSVRAVRPNLKDRSKKREVDAAAGTVLLHSL